MKKLAMTLIIFTFIYCPAAADQEITIKLEDAVAIALRDNRDVLLKAEDIKKAKMKVSEAEAGLFPTLNFTTTRGITRGYYAKDLDQTTTQTALKQYLYRGGKTVNTISQYKENLAATQALLDKARIETVLNVKKAFYTLLLTVEYADLNKGMVDNTRGHLAFIETRYKSGQESESEILKIKEALSKVKQAYQASLNQVESSQALLNNLLYLEKDVRVKPDGKFAYELKEIAYDEAFLKAVGGRPEIKQYEAEMNANKKAVEVAKADNRPSVYASWDYYSRSHATLTASKGWNDYNVIGITFSWPIFDGWATKAKVEQAIVDLKETQLLKDKTVKDIALELKTAYLDLKNAIDKIRYTEAQIGLYGDTVKVVKEKYNAGIASSLDLNDAQLSYHVSLFNQEQAVYDYVIAKAKFDKAMGGV